MCQSWKAPMWRPWFAFSRMRSEGFPFISGGLGVGLCWIQWKMGQLTGMWVWRIGRDGIPHSKKANGWRIILFIYIYVYITYMLVCIISQSVAYFTGVSWEKNRCTNEADITRCRSTPFSATWQGTQQNLWPQEFQIPWICGHRTVAADPGGNVFALKGEK